MTTAARKAALFVATDVDMQIFDIKAIPPSLNNIYFNVPGKGRKKTARYRTWINAAGWDVALAKPKLMVGPVTITILLNRPNKTSDVDNRKKALIDLLVRHGVLANDRQVQKSSIEWSDAVDGCRVFVERWEAA